MDMNRKISERLALKLGIDPLEKLPTYAWRRALGRPGGYPIVYYAKDCTGMMQLCPECAENMRSEEDFVLIDGDIHYEGPPMICELCNKEVESAYGDPDEPESTAYIGDKRIITNPEERSFRGT